VKTRHEPIRMCAGCGVSRPKRELIRMVRTPEGRVQVDESGKKSGRGIYICPSSECYARALKSRRLHRAFGGEPDPELAEVVLKLSGKG
jgi:predicted RNA-binding protein YlxR (DUF448 family)